MNWNTTVTELLGSKYPIIQGAFGGFGTSAPVSEAGGFGIITASSWRTPERLREDIKKARSMTDKPFGVNLSVGLCPRIDEMREVAIEEMVPVIFTSAYRADNHGKRIQEAGLKWVHKVATVQHALAAERQGADAVVIVGLEGTAFKSIFQLPTLISITTAVKQLKVPLIAAGGIGISLFRLFRPVGFSHCEPERARPDAGSAHGHGSRHLPAAADSPCRKYG